MRQATSLGIWHIGKFEMTTIETLNQKILRIGDAAPNFSARSTKGQISLSDYSGRWLILFSHPADFTPVCTTEFIALTKAARKFEKQGCSLLGLSVDSLFSHLAWIRTINERFDVKIDFPILEDPSMAVGRAYGMIDENSQDSATMRSSYYIDPNGIVRAIMTYPHNVGRSVNEMLRLLSALQATDVTGNLAPEGWVSSQPMLKPPPEMLSSDTQIDDWFSLSATDR